MERSTWSYLTDAFTRKNTFHVALFGFFPFLSGSLSCSLALRELLRGSARSIPFHHSAREVRFVQIRNALIPEEIRGAAQESKVRLSERGFARLFSSVYFPASWNSHPPIPLLIALTRPAVYYGNGDVARIFLNSNAPVMLKL